MPLPDNKPLRIKSISQLSTLGQKEREHACAHGVEFDNNLYVLKSVRFVRAHTPSAYQAFKELFTHRLWDGRGSSRARRITEQLESASNRSSASLTSWAHPENGLKKALELATQVARAQAQEGEIAVKLQKDRMLRVQQEAADLQKRLDALHR